MSNTKLEEHLAKLEQIRRSAKADKDIDAIITEIQTYSKNGNYDLKQPIVSALFNSSLLIFIFLAALAQSGVIYVEGLVLGIFSTASLILGVSHFARRLKSKYAGSNIAYTAVALKNGLNEVYDFDGVQLWNSLRQQFSIFKTGDEDQEITTLYNGQLDDGLDFQLFEFKYVEVREEEKEDSEGNKTTEIYKTTHYLYGLLSHLPNFSPITINVKNAFKEKWDSSSTLFNKHFKVRCSNPVAAAKFFTPSCVLRFEECFTNIKTVDMTLSSYTCISLGKDVSPTSVSTPKIKDVDKFTAYLRNPPSLPQLNVAKEFLLFVNNKNKLKRAVA